MSNETPHYRDHRGNQPTTASPRASISGRTARPCVSSWRCPVSHRTRSTSGWRNQVLTVLGRVAPNEFGEQVHAEYAVGNFERAFPHF